MSATWIPKLMPLLQSLVPRACKQGIKSKARAIKCCKEIQISSPPNEWRNIPLLSSTLIPSYFTECVINLDLITYDPVPLIVDRSNNFVYPENGTRILTIRKILKTNY